MDKKAQKLKEKIQKLTLQLKNIEEKHEKSIAKLIKDVSKKGIDIRVLTGMIIHAQDIMKDMKNKLEAWQDAGDKFLFKSKDKPAGKRDKPVKK